MFLAVCSTIALFTMFEEHVLSGVMLFVFLCRMPYLIAFYPCSMKWDGGAQQKGLYLGMVSVMFAVCYLLVKRR